MAKAPPVPYGYSVQFRCLHQQVYVEYSKKNTRGEYKVQRTVWMTYDEFRGFITEWLSLKEATNASDDTSGSGAIVPVNSAKYILPSSEEAYKKKDD